MSEEKANEQKKDNWDRFGDALDRWDNFKCKILPNVRYRRSIKQISSIIKHELKKSFECIPEVPTYTIRLFVPYDRQRYMQENVLCLSLFSMGFIRSYKISNAMTTLYWVKYKKHPAYAINDVTEKEERQIIEDIKREIEKREPANFNLSIQKRNPNNKKLSSSFGPQEWDLVAEVKKAD